MQGSWGFPMSCTFSADPTPVPMPLVPVVPAGLLSRGTSMAWCRLHRLAGGARLGTSKNTASILRSCVGLVTVGLYGTAAGIMQASPLCRFPISAPCAWSVTRGFRPAAAGMKMTCPPAAFLPPLT